MSDLARAIQHLVHATAALPDADMWQKVFAALSGMAALDLTRLDSKILAATLVDMELGYKAFRAFQHHRKIAIFGSARLAPTTPEYRMTVAFAEAIVKRGFMVLTGGGGGIMEAGNRGAGAENTFGLNIQLPFEQEANPMLMASNRVINFKYFFTRKLFFLKESDAVVLFPGGFGTQDEGFECLTLMQTGKTQLMPLVLLDVPGGSYWYEWDAYIRRNLLARGLISAEDVEIYQITSDIQQACAWIEDFYRNFHSHRWLEERLILRLCNELTDESVERLNAEFRDILVKGRIEKAPTHPVEKDDQTAGMPRLSVPFDQRSYGRLWQMIRRLNALECLSCNVSPHPELK